MAIAVQSHGRSSFGLELEVERYLRPEPVRIGEPANDFQVYFWNSLTFFRHVQLIDHFIGGGLDLWKRCEGRGCLYRNAAR